MAENIQCDFTRLNGYLFAPPDESDDILDKELDAVQRAGLNGVQMVARAPISSFDTGRCLQFPRQGQFHPLKYFAAVAQAIERMGGRIFSRTHVSRLHEDQSGSHDTGSPKSSQHRSNARCSQDVGRPLSIGGSRPSCHGRWLLLLALHA